MSKIGIIGGTFNPIHNGHIGIAKAAYDQYALDEIWFMPNHIPAYKNENEVLSGELRMDMIRLAIQNYPHFYLSDYELKRTGKTYTYQTLEKLSVDYPGNSFYFIMGADSLFYFEQWKHPETIVKRAKILVALRDDKGIHEVKEKISALSRIYGNDIFYFIKTSGYDCSSSRIRDAIFHNRDHLLSVDEFSSRYNIPKEVYHYIKKRNLYKNE